MVGETAAACERRVEHKIAATPRSGPSKEQLADRRVSDLGLDTYERVDG
jgi:hypothetical protein